MGGGVSKGGVHLSEGNSSEEEIAEAGGELGGGGGGEPREVVWPPVAHAGRRRVSVKGEADKKALWLLGRDVGEGIPPPELARDAGRLAGGVGWLQPARGKVVARDDAPQRRPLVPLRPRPCISQKHRGEGLPQDDQKPERAAVDVATLLAALATAEGGGGESGAGEAGATPAAAGERGRGGGVGDVAFGFDRCQFA